MISKHAEQARELIDLVADAIEAEEEKVSRYVLGRETILSYYEEHPKAVFAVAQASKYLLERVRKVEAV